MELPASKNWVERGWKPSGSSGMRSEGSGPRAARRGAAVSRKSTRRLRQWRSRGVATMLTGTGMAAYTYLYSLTVRSNTVSQTDEARQWVHVASEDQVVSDESNWLHIEGVQGER